MKLLRRTALFLTLYAVFLAWRFPYQAMVARSIDAFARSTNSQITYTPRSASLFGVQLDKLQLESAAGVKIEFGSARLRPGLGTLSVFLTQPNGQAQLNLERDGALNIHLENVQLESGSKEMGLCKVTAERISYNLYQKRGKGDLSIVVPKFLGDIPLPPDTPLEIGNTLAFEDKGSGFEVRSEVRMTGGADYEAHGQVMIDPQGRRPGRLSGTLEFSAPRAKRGTLRLEGTWKKPKYVVVFK